MVGRTVCPRCGAGVLATPGGLLLEREPHPLAIMLPGGGKLTAAEAVEVMAGRAAPAGHHPHSTSPGYGCGSAGRNGAAQLELFAA